MKRITTAVLSLVLLFSIPCALAESASVDLSAITLEELTTLKDQLNLAIWNSSEWKEVTVPQGIWEIGVDIPAGHWTIKPTGGNAASLEWGDSLNDNRTGIDMMNYIDSCVIVDSNSPAYEENSSRPSIDWELTDGTFIKVDMGSVIFTPYDGKLAFTFD